MEGIAAEMTESARGVPVLSFVPHKIRRWPVNATTATASFATAIATKTNAETSEYASAFRRDKCFFTPLCRGGRESLLQVLFEELECALCGGDTIAARPFDSPSTLSEPRGRMARGSSLAGAGTLVESVLQAGIGNAPIPEQRAATAHWGGVVTEGGSSR